MSKFRLLSVLAVIVLVLTACAPAATPTAAPAQPTQPVASQPTSAAAPATAPAQPSTTGQLAPIVVACWSGPEHDNLVKVAAEYEKATGNKVTVEEIARESYFDKLTTTFIAGSSDYDVAYVSSDWPPAWIKANALMDLDQFINDPNVVDKNFSLSDYEPAIDTFKFDGKVYAFPSEGDTAWMWYRKDLLEAKGIAVPQTWDEYLAAAKALNDPPDHLRRGHRRQTGRGPVGLHVLPVLLRRGHPGQGLQAHHQQRRRRGGPDFLHRPAAHGQGSSPGRKHLRL